MSGPIVDDIAMQTKRLFESISYYVKTNIFRRGRLANIQNKFQIFFN